MAVKVDDSDGTVVPVDTPQDGEDNGMVTSESDNPGKGPSLQSRTLLLSVGVGLSRQDSIMTLFDLVNGPGIVVAIKTENKPSS
jgi:hypothetical protein